MSRIQFALKTIFWISFAAVVGCQTPSKPADDAEKGAVPNEKQAAKTVSFVRDIKPILEDRCVMCHNRKVLPTRTSFENRKLALKGDAAGPIIVPGDAEGSRLVVAISAPDFLEQAMPPVSHRISKDEVALIRRWIDEGVEWPEGSSGDLKSDKVPAE